MAEGTVRMRLEREAGLGYSRGSDQQVQRLWDRVRASVAGVEWGREDGGVHRRPRGRRATFPSHLSLCILSLALTHPGAGLGLLSGQGQDSAWASQALMALLHTYCLLRALLST